MLTVLLGGARSGKSSLALGIAGSFGLPVTFIATAAPLDPEFAERIDRHRAERPSDWQTIEEPIDLEAVIAQVPHDVVVVVDCLTLWVSNLFGHDLGDAAILERASGVAEIARLREGPTVVVSNEVGSGIVPTDALSRRYRDTLGRVNATFATQADEAFLVVAGRVLPLRDLDLSANASSRSRR
jgi:adenosyl cobinamide kinase/adenosyl cobinamide phosphate guanylyltransferase